MSRVAVVTGDLMTLTRVDGIVASLGHESFRADDPVAAASGAPDAAAILVSWDERQPGWLESLRDLITSGDGRDAIPRIVLFGSHRDLDGHREARRAGLGPVVARSALPTKLVRMLRVRDRVSDREVPPARR